MAPGTEDRSAARRRVHDYLHDLAPEARRPAVDAVVWLTNDRIEGGAQILLEDGDEQVDLVAGSGSAEVVVHTNTETLVRVAWNPAELDEAKRAGRWRTEGPTVQIDAFEASFAGACAEDVEAMDSDG